MSTVPQRGNAILKRLARTPADAPRVAEVGVWRGALSAWLLTMHPTLRLVMVDRWAAVPAGHRYHDSEAQIGKQDQAAHEQAMADALRLTADHADRTDLYRGESIDVARMMDDRSFDFVFIDADHTYEGVAEDLRAWWPKVRPGGWIAGHDWGNQPPIGQFWGVERAVREFADTESLEIELDDDSTWFARSA